MSKPMITVLVTARKNSKYLAKFLMNLIAKTNDWRLLDVKVMVNYDDTWNEELALVMRDHFEIEFWGENSNLGRHGIARFFNSMLPDACGDWIVYFCDDHSVIKQGWDSEVLDYIHGRKGGGDSENLTFPLNPNEPWVIVPKFDNAGSMNHIVSRGYVKAMGSVIGNHGWIDSYINDLMSDFTNRVIRMEDPIFHDFTHDVPSPMSDEHTKITLSEEVKSLPEYNSEEYHKQLDRDKLRIKQALEGLNAFESNQKN
jgi:hypothetical protein